MKYLFILITLVSTYSIKAQECSPYFDIPKYELSNKKSGGIGYISCFHARGVVAEAGYDKLFIGLLAMGEGHHGAVYTFLQYEFAIRELRIYGGPAYRLNHNPSILIGRAGVDYQIISYLYGTFSILQVNPQLNYVHVGLKLVI